MASCVQAHPRASKEERRSLCRLIDARKLSAEAAAHAVQNDRLPVRCVVQVLFLSEHGGGGGGAKLSHHRLAEWSGGSFRDLQIRSPSPALDLPSAAVVAAGARCPSKREVAAAQHHELRRLREDVARLQVRPCHDAMNVVTVSFQCDAWGADGYMCVRGGRCSPWHHGCRCSATRCRRRWTG